MTNNLFKILSMFLIFGAVACTQAPDSDKAKVEAPKKEVKAPAQASAKNFTVDTAKSSVSWVGTKPTGRHNGVFTLSDGVISTDGKSISGGKFTIDMGSLKALDQDEEGNKNLAGHLMSDDFFKVAKFPKSEFVVTSVAPFTGTDTKLRGATHTITGNLTMLGVSKSVSFPAVVEMKGNGLSAKADFNINRTDWGLSYGSDKSLGDKFIRPEVNIALNIVGK